MRTSSRSTTWANTRVGRTSAWNSSREAASARSWRATPSRPGRPPFAAETAEETVLQVIYHEPAPPSRLNAQVPRDLETICLKCLHKEPERRYASAAALADDLRRFQEGRPIQARPLGWGGRLWRWGRRKPAAAALVVTALALVGLALGGGLWLERQQADRRAEEARQGGREWQGGAAGVD